MIWAASLLLVSVQSPATPTDATVTAQTGNANVTDVRDSTLFRAAHKLADIHMGGTKMSSEAQATVRAQLMNQFSKMEDFLYLEQEYPGVTQAVADAAVPIAIRQIEDTTPDVIDRLAVLYSNNMTLEELEDLTEWLTTPTMTRVRSLMESNFDLGEIMAGAADDEDYQISTEALQRVKRGSAEEAVSSISPEDIAVIVSFSEQESFKKYLSIKPQAIAIETAWTNESTPAEEVELEAAVTQALENFTGLDLSDVE